MNFPIINIDIFFYTSAVVKYWYKKKVMWT